MKRLSLKPDADMKWIYDNNHPDYNTPRVRHLRDARDAAIRSAPEWMIKEAEMNDSMDEQEQK